MKKIYNLLAVMMLCILAFGFQSATAQEPIWQEDFAGVTGSGTQQCEASSSSITSTLSTVLPGWSGDFVYPANGKVKLGTGSVDGWIETPAIEVSGSIRIDFDARCWNGSDQTKMLVTVNGVEHEVTGLLNYGSANTEECDMTTFSVMASAGGAAVIRFTGQHRIFLDNIKVYADNSPSIAITGENEFGNVGVGETKCVDLVARAYNLTPGGTSTVTITGDSHFTTTTATCSNDALMSEAGVTISVCFNSDATGDFESAITISNADGNVTMNLSATVIQFVDVPTIDQLRALIDNSNVEANVTDSSAMYRYTGNGYITQVFKNGSYNKWMQDETGAIQLYDPAHFMDGIPVGVAVSNVVGLMANYKGYTELNVQSNVDQVPFPSYIPQPVVVTLEQLQDQEYMDGIQAQLIKLENVVINGTGNFAKGRYTVTQNGITDTAINITGSYDTQYGENIPTGTVDIIGVNVRASVKISDNVYAPSRYYIYPRNFEGVSAIANNEMATVNVYPNPFENNIVVEVAENATNVAVYNAFGQMVASQSVASGINTINTENFAAGMYIVKVYNDNQVIGFAKIVKK